MSGAAAEPPSFLQQGSADAESPVVLAVPHAGRIYPEPMLADSRVPRATLEQLADREADRLIEAAVAAGAAAVIATRARAWIDLNRDPREIDPALVSPPPRAGAVLETARVRGGLGLIPRRVAGHGEIARRPLAQREIEARIAEDHEPYHRAIAGRLAAARARWGTAVLLDIHSMPTLDGERPARVVVGDRHGRSAGRRERELVLGAARAHWPAARNTPYAGGYTLDRHGRPGRGIHAIQIEFDRALYLAPDGSLSPPGTMAIAHWLARVVRQFGEAVRLPAAAE